MIPSSHIKIKKPKLWDTNNRSTSKPEKNSPYWYVAQVLKKKKNLESNNLYFIYYSLWLWDPEMETQQNICQTFINISEMRQHCIASAGLQSLTTY